MLKRISLLILICIPLFSYANPPLPSDKAFNVKVEKLDPNTFKINFKLAAKYFLYKNCLQIINTDKEIMQIGNINFPTPKMKKNRQGQLFPVYHDELALNIPILSEKPGESFLELRYQGCSDEGFCYPPERKLIKVAFKPDLSISDVALENAAPKANLPEKVAQEIQKEVTNDFDKLFASNNIVMIILSFLGFGILLAFTPCILPMVPVLSGIIVGHGKDISSRKAFLLSLSYVLSMSVTYGVIGAVIALLGSNLQVAMQTPIVIASFSLIFVLLALSMFDLYEIKLPMSIQNKLAGITKSQTGSHYLNAIILGSMSILVLSPCVSAPLIGALSYIAQSGDVALGVTSLFFLSFGMGIPLLLIGTSAGKLLPKAGTWMNTVKSIFGVLLLGVAIYLLSRIIPIFLSMLMWSALCIFSGVFLRPFNKIQTNQDKFKQGMAILLISYGLLILYGASSGNADPLQPLKNNCQPSAKLPANSKIVKTLPETLNALKEVQNANLPAVLYFYADWCASCHIISSTTLQNEGVLRELQKVKLIKVDLTQNNAASQELLNYFHVIAPPTFIFINKKDKKTPSGQLVGEINSKEFISQLLKM